MDFLNTAFSQLGDLFRSMTPAARITTGLLLVVVVVSLGYLFHYQVSGPDCDLMNGEPIPYGYSEKMEAAFAAAGLKQYEVRGAHILVPQGEKADYMAALADGNALPPNFGRAMRDALTAGSTFESNKESERRIRIGIQEELALWISEMRGIERAYVLYDTEVKPGLRGDKRTTATVGVQPEGSEHLDGSQVSAIRHLVAPAIGGLRPENVTVTDLKNGRSYYGDAESGGDPLDDPYGARKRMYEQEWTAKILNLLDYIDGVRVALAVELVPELVNRTDSVSYEKPTTIQESIESTTRTRENGTPGGQPGLQAQGPNQPISLASVQAQGSEESEEDSREERISAPNTRQTQTEKAGLIPKRVSVAINIPTTYLEGIWKERNPTEEGEEPQTPDPTALQAIEDEEKTRVQEAVVNLLPAVEGVDDPAELVAVNVFTPVPGDPIPAPGAATKALTWFGSHWGTLGMIGLGLFSLVMLRSMIRAVPTGPRPAGRAAASVPDETDKTEEDESAAVATARRLARFVGGGPSLRDELSELVQEDTNAAANILRTWIGKAG